MTDLRSLIMQLAQGNPGALRVCCDLTTTANGAEYLAEIEKIGLRGSDIWIAYKDICGEDLVQLTTMLRETSKDLRRRVTEANSL